MTATAVGPPASWALQAARRAGASAAGAQAPAPRCPRRPGRRRLAPPRAAEATQAAPAGFHVSRMQSTERREEAPPLADLRVVLAEADDELEAAAWLRAMSFYAYPPERKFAGEIHQLMVQEEEYQLLKAARMARRLAELQAARDGGGLPRERSACLVALSAEAGVLAATDARLVVEGRGAVVGTLDLHAVRALDGQVLIGDCTNAAYLGNVCTNPAARRRGVGQALIAAVRGLAREWEVQELYVHTLAVNEIGRRFYDGVGFVLEKEESSNTAHYRGRCLDGVEGAGRTLLLRDARLRAPE